jgi:hypothetical protein
MMGNGSDTSHLVGWVTVQTQAPLFISQKLVDYGQLPMCVLVFP